MGGGKEGGERRGGRERERKGKKNLFQSFHFFSSSKKTSSGVLGEGEGGERWEEKVKGEKRGELRKGGREEGREKKREIPQHNK